MHQDEGRPHIHAAVIPENDKKHLSYKQYFGQPILLKQLQASYAKVLDPLGVIPHTKAEKAALAPGYTKGIHGWRVGRAIMEAKEHIKSMDYQIREREHELQALTPEVRPVNIKRPALLRSNSKYWGNLERLWAQMQQQLHA